MLSRRRILAEGLSQGVGVGGYLRLERIEGVSHVMHDHRIPEADHPIKPNLPNRILGRNKHGHTLVRVLGRPFTGSDEMLRLQKEGFILDKDKLESFLLSTSYHSYNFEHRLSGNTEYLIAIISGRTLYRLETKRVLDTALLDYGYIQPLAGIMPRLREQISGDMMREWDICFIVGMHEPLTARDCKPGLLAAGHGHGIDWFSAFASERRWDEASAFAFLVDKDSEAAKAELPMDQW